MVDLNRNWRWERNGCRVYTDQTHRGRPMKVADVSIAGLDEPGLEARGRLIAAAPDLLEALSEVQVTAAALVGAVLSGDHRAMLIAADAVNVGHPKRHAAITRADGGGA